MATSTAKDINSATRGSYVDETDGTTAQQVTLVGNLPLDDRYIKKAGDTVTGTIIWPTDGRGFEVWSADGSLLWQMQVDDTGAWIMTNQTPVNPPPSGSPFGPYLYLTYA